MKSRKIMSGLLAIALMLTINSGTVSAGEIKLDSMNQDAKMKYAKMEEVALDKSKEDNRVNYLERQYEGEQYKVKEGISDSRKRRNTAENTDPNYAYIVEDSMVVQGTVEAANEARWYAFILNEKSKITLLAQMVEAMDADLYLFSLNEETLELELIGGSANAGKGITEYTCGILEAGTYFFAIQGYEGTGNYAFAFYQNTSLANEVNDTPNMATVAKVDSKMTGVIDNPYDIDYYKITLTSAVLMKYSFTGPANYEMKLESNDGKVLSMPTANTYKFFPGTYYFKVQSKDTSSSLTQEYSITTTKISNMSSDSRADVIGICEKANIYYETDLLTVHYVNGNSIDPSYSYIKNLSNSQGRQSYNMVLDKSKISNVVMSGVYEPDIIYYISSTRPAMSVGSKYVLSLTFTGDRLYRIHNYCTGAYSMNNFSQDFDAVNVLIDPETGKLVDILEFNYYYDFAPVGSNQILFTRPGWGLDFYQIN